MHLGGEGVDRSRRDPGRAGDGECASLSTLLATREALEAVGPCEEEHGDSAPLRQLVRMARAMPLHHVREVTIESRGPLAEARASVEGVRAGSHLDAEELLRALMAAHAREEGLRARLAELEGDQGPGV